MYPDSTTAPARSARAAGFAGRPLEAEEFWPDDIDVDFPDDPSEPDEEWLEDSALEDLEGFRRRGSPENPGF